MESESQMEWDMHQDDEIRSIFGELAHISKKLQREQSVVLDTCGSSVRKSPFEHALNELEIFEEDSDTEIVDIL